MVKLIVGVGIGVLVAVPPPQAASMNRPTKTRAGLRVANSLATTRLICGRYYRVAAPGYTPPPHPGHIGDGNRLSFDLMIVVTGSTGRVGGLVVRRLQQRRHRIRLLVRDPSRAPRIDGMEVEGADYGDPDALAKGLRKGDRVFMVSLWIGGDTRLDLHRSFVDAAAKADVAHLVYLSFVNAGLSAIFSHAQEHGATEEMLRASGVPWTSIRNSMYADDIPGWFDPDGVAREPGDDARMSFSYRPELADVIAVALTEPGHEGRIYNITTPESVSMRELAQIASEVTGDAYRYEPISDGEWIQRWKAQGRPDWALEAGQTSYEALRAGEFDLVSDDYEEVTSQKPRTIAQIIAAVAAEMPLAATRRSP
jgi:NAD(P)H dehydrogenase (quinone)